MKHTLPENKALLAHMKADRGEHDDIIEDVQALVLPYRGDVQSEWTADFERTSPTFDATAVVALHALASYLQGSIFSPGEKWLRLTIPGRTPTQEERVALDTAASEILAELDNSNFYSAMNCWLKDLAGIGNATLLIEERPNRYRGGENVFGGMDFEAVPYARIWRTLDRMRRPILVAREFELHPIEADEFFKSTNLTHRDPNKKECYYNLIRRSEDKWVSYWWRSDSEDHIASEELDFMPYVPAVWDTVDGHSYGYGQGHLVRPCIAGMQQLSREVIQAVGRDLNPLLMVNHDSFMNLDVGQNGIVTMKRAVAGDQRPDFLRSGSNFAAADQIRRLDKEQVEKAFFADALFPPDTQERSAAATRARMMLLTTRMAGPSQNINIHLQEIVGSMIRLMRNRGALAALDGIGEVTPVFVSPFFSGAKAAEIDRIQGFIAEQAQIAALLQDPEWMDSINKERAIQLISELTDVPARALNGEEELARIKQGRAAAAANQEMREDSQSGVLQTQLELGRGNLPGVG